MLKEIKKNKNEMEIIVYTKNMKSTVNSTYAGNKKYIKKINLKKIGY